MNSNTIKLCSISKILLQCQKSKTNSKSKGKTAKDRNYLLSRRGSGFRRLAGGRRAGIRGERVLLCHGNRRRRQDLDDVDLPEDPVLRGGPVGDVVRNGVPPRGKTAVGAEEVAVPRLQLDGAVLPDRLPLNGAVEARRQRLQHLPPRHAEEERLVRRREVLAVAAPQPDYVVGVLHELHRPFRRLGGAAAVLRDGGLVVLGDQVLAVGALQAYGLRVLEQLHC